MTQIDKDYTPNLIIERKNFYEWESIALTKLLPTRVLKGYAI